MELTAYLHPWLFFHEWPAVDGDRDGHVAGVDGRRPAVVRVRRVALGGRGCRRGCGRWGGGGQAPSVGLDAITVYF